MIQFAGRAGDFLVEDGEVPVGDEDAGVVVGETVLLYEAGAHLVGQLREAALYLAEPGRGDLQRQEVGFGEVAVVVGVLLAPELVYLVVVRVVVEGRLLDAAAGLEDPALALQLSREPPLDEAEGVHVLELGLGAKGPVRISDADVGVAAELALLHVRLRDAYGAEYVFQVVGRRARRLGRWYVGLSNDLH